jgi:hypothetical protein
MSKRRIQVQWMMLHANDRRIPYLLDEPTGLKLFPMGQTKISERSEKWQIRDIHQRYSLSREKQISKVHIKRSI